MLLEKLNNLGFMIDGKLNASDRFTAIMSGTMRTGNYFQNVWDSIRHDGLLPEKDFPFGGNSWDEYHNRNLITQEMKDKAIKILDIFDFAYEWTTVGDGLAEDLKRCPLHVAIPKVATHAVELIKMDYIFDTYPPFLYQRNTEIGYALRVYVTVKDPIIEYKYFKLTEKTGGGHTVAELNPALMVILDKMREECGFPFVITSGVRTKAENSKLEDSVSNSAHLYGLAVDIRCRNSTERYKMIESLYKNGIRRWGEGKNFIHIDIDTMKAQDVAWHYY